LRFVVSHTFCKERERMGHEVNVGGMSEKNAGPSLRCASLWMTEFFEGDRVLLGLIVWGVTGINEWQT
jgi:hypothetical protein